MTAGPQPYIDPDLPLSARQQALLALCTHHDIVVGDPRGGTGSDVALYFPKRVGPSLLDPEPTIAPAELEPDRYCAITYCAITHHEDHHYLYPLYGTVRAAKARAVEFIVNDTFVEMPLAVVDLDTGKRWDAAITATWRPVAHVPPR